MAVDHGWIERVTSLKQWRRGGERAPHKPLLLLYALGRLQRFGSSAMAFADVESDLRQLLNEFGPPRPTSPGYPFHHLVSDGFWTVRMPGGSYSPGPSLGALRAGAVGELTTEFASSVEESPTLYAAVVRAILDGNFPDTLHDDILEAVGIELESVELAPAPGVVSRRRRDPAFRERVLTAYEYRCAACGYDGQFLREAVGIDAAHVRWWAAEGPDEVANALALCSLHHKLLDRGAMGITQDRRVAVSSHFIGRGSAASSVVLSLVGRPFFRPQRGQPVPHRDHILWHGAEVFRGPARISA